MTMAAEWGWADGSKSGNGKVIEILLQASKQERKRAQNEGVAEGL